MNNSNKIIHDCPFCEGDADGCCFCDHTGKIKIGEGEFFKSPEQAKSIGVKFIKQHDPGEIWAEMIEYFLDDNNVPDWYKEKPKEE